MIFSPTKEDFFSLLNILGKFLTFLGILFLIPLALAFGLKEYNPLYDFTISFFICESAGFLLMAVFSLKKELDYSLSLLLVAILWIAIPLNK